MNTTMPRVLIVDDDPDIRDLLAFSFGRAGYEIHTAADGRDALDSVSEHALDLVILDWMMPRLDGIGFCRQLRADGRNAGLPVIFLSARTSAGDVTLGLAAGAKDFVTKPFSPRSLVLRAHATLTSMPVAPRSSAPTPVPGGCAG